MAKYMFDTEIAKAYGVEEAIVIANLVFWLETNKANNVNFHDGRYWTYNTLNAFVRLFPFWTAKQIRRIFDSLERQNVIIKSNHNETTYDRTLWYALTDEFIEKWSQTKAFVTDIEPFAQTGKCKCPNGQMDLPKRENGFAQMGTPIPYNKPNNKPNESVGGAEAPAAPQGADAPSLEDKEKKDKHPSLKEIQAFCQEKGYTIDTLQFYSYYESNGWMVGKTKMKNWKAAVVNWYCRDKKDGKVATTTPIPQKPLVQEQRAAAPVHQPTQEEIEEAERRAYFDKKMEDKRIREEAAYRAQVEARKNHSFRPAARLNLQTQEQ